MNIQKLMNVEGLTRSHVASHLQVPIFPLPILPEQDVYFQQANLEIFFLYENKCDYFLVTMAAPFLLSHFVFVEI